MTYRNTWAYRLMMTGSTTRVLCTTSTMKTLQMRIYTTGTGPSWRMQLPGSVPAGFLTSPSSSQPSIQRYMYISLLLNCIVIHGYLPNDLMSSVIVPIVKNKKGNITDMDNYRPIAITTVFLKSY